MSINSDFAQYREWGLTTKEPYKLRNVGEKDTIPPIIDDVESKHVKLPGWLNHKRGKAKL